MTYRFFLGASSTRRSVLKFLIHEAGRLVEEEVRARRIVGLACLLSVCIFLLYLICHSTSSMSMYALAYLLIFDLTSLGVSMLSLWIDRQNPNVTYTFGYQRFEVVAVFASTMLGVLGGFFMLKECVERFFEMDDKVEPHYIVIGSLLMLAVHLLVVYGVDNRALNHVIDASHSSWLQEHVTDISESLCQVTQSALCAFYIRLSAVSRHDTIQCHLLQWVPGLSKVLLPRLHPISLLGLSSALVTIFVDFVINAYGYYAADSLGAIVIAIMMFGTMMPMSIYR